MKRLLPALLLFVVGCNGSFTASVICRGDTTPARQDTSLVRCSTLDSLAVGR